jgi:SWI/SNF-related matrix-associated actin-dependent regulator 1 of chromatin subfamily A
VIINYAIVYNCYQKLIDAKFDCVACDECQYLTNPKSKRTIYASKIISSIPKRIMSSGTPIRNNEKEFFVPLSLLRPDISDFQSFRMFSQKYCRKEKITLKNANQNFDYNFNNLNNLLNLLYLRRLKKDVLPQLPPKIKQNFPLELNDSEFNTYKNIMIKNTNDNGVLSAITKTKQYLSNLKINKIIPYIENIIKHNKIIIYSQYVDTLKNVHEIFPASSLLHYGKLSNLQRQKNIDQFQTNPNIKILVANVETAVGYTATSASYIFHLDYKWTPCDIDQSDDRAHRIGQTKSVNIKYLYFPNTIEEQILTLLNQKSKLMSKLLNIKLSKKHNDNFSIRKDLMIWVKKIIA